MIVGFLLATAIPTGRVLRDLNVPGQPHLPRYGLVDFRDAFYYPAVALSAGHNPYDEATYLRTYPVGDSFPLYSPVSLVLHLPFALLPLRQAGWLHYFLNVAFGVLVAVFSLRLVGLERRASRVFGIAALLVLSRPGHMNLFLGQCTAYVVLGVLVALCYARSCPRVAGLGLAVSYLKPTYGVPLALLMLCRQDTRAVVWGTTFGIMVSAAVLPFLTTAAGGVGPLLASLRQNYQAFGGKPSAHGIYRIDAVWLCHHLLGVAPGGRLDVVITLVMLGLAGLAVRRLGRGADRASGTLSASLICVTVLSCTYHQAYDALILTFPLVALVVDGRELPLRLGVPSRRILIGLMTIPAVNYLASMWGMGLLAGHNAWWQFVITLNSAAVLTAFTVYLGAAWHWTASVPLHGAPACRPAG